MDDVGDTLNGGIKNSVDGEVWDDDWEEAVARCELHDGCVGCDYVGFLLGSYCIADRVAGLKCEDENAEANQAGGSCDEDCCCHIF